MRLPPTILVLVSILSAAFAQNARADECAGVRMRQRAQLGDQTLLLNGMGVREVSFLRLDVYVAGLYLSERSRNASAILNSDQPKRLVLHFVRSANRSRMQSGLGGHFDEAGLTSEFARFVQLLPNEIESGTQIALTHRPGAGVEVAVNGRRSGVIASEAFARAFFEMLLGANAEDSDLRDGLLGGDCD